MKGLDRYTLSISAAAALLAGCGAPRLPIGAPDVVPQSRVSAMPADRTGPWMLPEAKSEDLLYVSTVYSGVYVYSYPAGKLVGMVEQGVSLPYGLCTDLAGDVFIADFSGITGVVEFAHGGLKPIRTLYGLYGLPFSATACSVDPTTGNLAATVSDSSGVFIYQKARGTPTVYGDSQIIMYFCTYDAKGNLFVDQVTNGKGSYIGELQRHAKLFKYIKLTRHMGPAGGILWDGKYIAVGDLQTDIVYRLKVSGAFGIVVGTVALTGSKEVREFWIDGNRLIGPDQVTNKIEIWNYPAGGPYVSSIEYINEPLGSTISLAPQRSRVK